MDSPRKNNDCYFYYYSTCLKGDGCMFRHEPAALGCETVCTFWQQGKCLNQRCNFRHMELRKNRKIIPCYWENQPGGCRKPHCSFQHKNPKEATGQDLEKKDCEPVGAAKSQERADWPRRTVLAEGAQYEECVGSSDNDSGRVGPRRVSQGSEASYGSPPVDPLVVNFEEESDNESAPSSTPTKKPQKNVHVKTLEEIRLERVQAESAAFYSYHENPTPVAGRTDLRSRIAARKSYSKPSQDFRVLTLDEIRKNRSVRKHADYYYYDDDDDDEPVAKRLRRGLVSTENDPDGGNGKLPVENETGESMVNVNIVKSYVNRNAGSNLTKNNDDQPSKKRSHSPVTFDVSPKRFANMSNEEHKENEASDGSIKGKDTMQAVRKLRKPLKRGAADEASNEKEQSKVVRLRRKKTAQNNSNSIDTSTLSYRLDESSEILNNNSMFLEVPANNMSLSSSHYSEISLNTRGVEDSVVHEKCENGIIDSVHNEEKLYKESESECFKDFLSDTKNVPKNLSSENDFESEGAMLQETLLKCDSIKCDQTDLSGGIELGEEDDLLDGNLDTSVIPEGDLLRDIDELLNE